MQESEIVQAAERLLCDFYKTQDIDSIELPIDPIAIAKEIGLKIYQTRLDDHVDGVYDKNKKTIYVSQSSPKNRQVFTVAHEWGHYHLHKDKDFDVFYRRDLETLGRPKFTEEREANSFAANLLMPKKLITKYYKQYEQDNAIAVENKLAEKFRVSEIAIRWRLHNLGLKKMWNGVVYSSWNCYSERWSQRRGVLVDCQ